MAQHSLGASRVTGGKAVKSGRLGFGSKFFWLHSNKWMRTDFTDVASNPLQDEERPFPPTRNLYKVPPLVAGLQRSRAAWRSGAPRLEAPVSGL